MTEPLFCLCSTFKSGVHVLIAQVSQAATLIESNFPFYFLQLQRIDSKSFVKRYFRQQLPSPDSAFSSVPLLTKVCMMSRTKSLSSLTLLRISTRQGTRIMCRVSPCSPGLYIPLWEKRSRARTARYQDVRRLRGYALPNKNRRT